MASHRTSRGEEACGFFAFGTPLLEVPQESDSVVIRSDSSKLRKKSRPRAASSSMRPLRRSVRGMLRRSAVGRPGTTQDPAAEDEDRRPGVVHKYSDSDIKLEGKERGTSHHAMKVTFLA
jgi:hypothetical protein